MTERERFLESLLFGKPDKVFFAPGGPRESTLKRWHQEGLPENANWFDFLCEAIGVRRELPQAPKTDFRISFGLIPEFEEKMLEHKDGHYVVQDAKGAVVEISDVYDFSYLRSAKDFVTRKWHKFPVENEQDWSEMKKRYNPQSPERYPENIPEVSRILKNRDYALGLGIPGPFWQMRDWCGFENLCMMMAEKTDFIEEMVLFWRDFVLRVLEPFLKGIAFDYVILNEDMAYKEKSMISPAMTEKFLVPVWSAWTQALKRSGCPVVAVDSDGYIEELIPSWISSGVNCCTPIEVAAGNDLVKLRRRFGREMAYWGGIDKRAIAKGGKTMEQEVYRVVPELFRTGGYIPGCDHGVPPDISWQNFVEYSRLLAKLSGWL